MKRFLLLFCLYFAFIVALIFLATPPDSDIATVNVGFEYQNY